jgi:hypothetical protein
MATITANVTNSNTVTITLSSVTNTSVALSSAIDNSTSKYVEAIVQVKIKTGAAGTSATGFFNVYIVRSTDGGTSYADSTDELLGTIPAVANATTYNRAFRSAIPGTHFKIAVENRSGGTTDTTAGNHSCVYSGVKYDVA